jgi:predicted ATP-grasp superfamily ATP-dependent carboligase
VNPSLINYTIKIYEDLGFSGFGSIEYKKSTKDGKYYIMEPTVGRPDHQSFISTANGINMPLIAYANLTGEIYITNRNTNNEHRIWIDEQYELGTLLYLLRRRKINLWKWAASLRGKKTYRFINRDDPLPAFYCIFSSLKYLYKFIQGKKKL